MPDIALFAINDILVAASQFGQTFYETEYVSSGTSKVSRKAGCIYSYAHKSIAFV